MADLADATWTLSFDGSCHNPIFTLGIFSGVDT